MGASKGKGGKGKRRARGTGTIFRRPDGTWVGRKPVGRTPAGTTRYREVQAKTQAEVVRKLDAVGPPGPDVTVAGWADRWLSTLQQRPSTRHLYRKTVRLYVGPLLGSVRLRDLTPSRVERFAVDLAARGIGPNTARTVLAHLSNLLRAAVRDDLIPSNPAALARRPKSRRAKIDPFTPAELAVLIRESAASPATYPVALLAATGCRVGEAIALDVADLARAGDTATITKTYDRDHGVGPPKSEAGVRTIRVPDAAVPVLRLAAGGREGGPLFESGAGRRRVAQLVGQAWGRLLARLGMRYRNPHQLRHSVATAMISAGDPPGDVAKYLGDTVETVVKTYLHPTGADPSRTMDRLLGGGKVGTGGAEPANPRKSKGRAG